MKKSTGIVFLIVLALGAFAYFHEWKHPPAPDPATADNSKPLFSISAADILNMTITRAGTTTVIERRPDGWYIAQPLQSKADQTQVDALASQLASAKGDRPLPLDPDSMKTFGLNDPVVSIAFAMKNSQKHILLFGAKDFSGMSVYALADGSKNATLVPEAVLTAGDKNLDDFRDHSVMTVSATDATSFELSNPGGDFTAAKSGDDWKLEKPQPALADSTTVTTMLGVMTSANISHFVPGGEKPADLAKYGLAKPAIVFRVKLADGKTGELQVGKKDGDEYDARDPARPMVFKISENLYKSLSTKYSELQDKAVVHFMGGDIARAEMHNQTGSMNCVPGPDGGFFLDQPGQKSVGPGCPNFVWSIASARGDEVYDAPPPGVAALLARPAVKVNFTTKAGKMIELRATNLTSAEPAGKIISDPTGKYCYAQTSEAPQVFRLDAQLFAEMNAAPPAPAAK